MTEEVSCESLWGKEGKEVSGDGTGLKVAHLLIITAQMRQTCRNTSKRFYGRKVKKKKKEIWNFIKQK